MPTATPRCEICRYWSQLVARIVNGGPIEAVCLLRTSPYAGSFTAGTASCDSFRAGIYAVDAPGGERRAA